MPTTGNDRLRVSVLGPVRAWRGDRELDLGPARQRALFAVLAAAGGRTVGRDELVEAVWGASPPATAVGSVYTYVSGLRRVLGRETLSSGPAGYALQLGSAEVDSSQFASLRAEAAELLASGDPAGALARLDEALGLWRGEAYAGLGGHRLELERAALAERRLDAVEQRARLLVEGGDDGVVAELAGLVRGHPLHEPLYELLMRALDRAGRRTEAIEVYRTLRHTLRTELSVEPGGALTALYERMRAAAPVAGTSSGGTPAGQALAGGTPSGGALAGRTPSGGGLGGRALAGREGELALLRGLAGELAGGRGAAVWIEGEPGIGKTELLTAAFADTGWRLAWGVAEELDQHVPLEAVGRALGLPPDAGRLLAQVREICAAAPLVLVVDDLQWAGESGVPFWDRLVAATRRMPLLLVIAARPDAGPEPARLRRGVRARRGHVLRLGPLPPEAIEQLVAGLAGAPLGPHLARAVAVSSGNPLHAREVTTALLRRGVVTVDGGRADIPAATPIEAPRSLLAAIRSTVDLLSPGAQETLRTAALLGSRFAVDDVAAVSGRPPFDLVAGVEEALAAGVVTDAGTDLEFRNPFLREVLYESIPVPARAALHRHTAEVLDRGGSPVTRVAEQLAAHDAVADDWVVAWMVTHHAELARRAPQIAAALLRRTWKKGPPQLLVALVKVDFRNGRRPLDEARDAAGLATDPADRAEMRHLAATMTYGDGDIAAAIGILRDSLADPELPGIWRTRHRVLMATFRRGPLDDLDQADRTAEEIRAEALAAGHPYEAAFALQTRWLTSSIRRDHERALEHVDRALDIMRDHPAFTGLYVDLLDNRTLTLQSLDRLEEAERTLREGALFALRHRLPSGPRVASATQHYWAGRWDDVLAEVSTVTDDPPGSSLLGMREPGAVAMLLHGLAGLVAAHRDDAVLAGGHLDSAEARPASEAERESGDFLLVARSLVAEQRGRAEEALRMLEPLLTPGYAPLMLRHQWLPDATRLALSLGRRDVAERAADVCAGEAAKEVRPARARWAAERCRALLTGDPGPALEAAAHYRRVGRVPELAAAAEDAAVLLAASRRPHEAARGGAEAVELYTMLGARWDLRRTLHRLADYGVEPAVDACVRP